MNRSYLYAAGHDAEAIERAFSAGADAVMLDLEDGVPDEAKAEAREIVSRTIIEHSAWVRINAPRTDAAAADLEALGDRPAGIRIPKVASAADVEWVTARAPGTPLICAIESARGVLAAEEIAAVDGVRHLATGGKDLRHDLFIGTEDVATLYIRSHIVVVSRAAGIDPPVDSLYPMIDDDAGLRAQATTARSLGFFGKSARHARQLPIIHAIFSPTAEELDWARETLAGADDADRARARRARRLLELAARDGA